MTLLSPNAPLGAIAFEFRAAGTANVLYRAAAALTPTGAGSAFGRYTLNGVPFGTYDIAVKGPKQLRVVLPRVALTAATALPDLTLPAGDANNDNSVDSSDFGALIGAFNTDGSIAGSGYDPTADFNYDGFLDSSDFALLIGEFNNTGAM